MGATGLVTFLFDLLAAAEQKTSLAACLGLWDSGLHELFHVLLKMEAQFIVEFAVDGGAIKKRSEPRMEVGKDVVSAEHVHGCVPLCRFKNMRDGNGQSFPLAGFRFQLFAAEAG